MANLLARFFGRTASEGAAFALGVATGPVLAPAVEEVKNEAWRTYPTRALSAGEAAEIVAEDVERLSWGQDEASAHGFSNDRFAALLGAVLNAPGFSELLEARRRGLVTDAEFHHGLRKAKLETLWDDALFGLLEVLLSPAELANAVVQGHMTQDAAAAEAAKQGVDRARFDVMVENTGLPPGPETLLAWRRRGIISQAELEQGIREGHTKVKYIGPYEDALTPILPPSTYTSLWLRGRLTQAEAEAGTALSGWNSEMTHLDYLNKGRPATVHQIHIGYARGATVPGAANEEDAIRQSVRRSNVRTEYEDILYASRYTLPTWFALRALLTGGAITEARAADLLKQSGWPPDLAEEVAAFYAEQTTATPVNPRVKRAQDQVVNATHKSYMDNELDRAQAIGFLERIGLSATVAGQVVDVWEIENEAAIKPLTPAAIKKAYKANDFTIDEAVSRLVFQQWTATDANIYLTT